MPRRPAPPALKPGPDGFWEIRWSEQGRSKRRSTRTRDLAIAKQILAGFLAGQREEQHQVFTVAEVIRAHEKATERLPTAQHRTVVWRRLEAALGALAAGELDDPTLQRDYVQPRLREAATGTVRKEVALLVAAIRRAHDDGHIPRMPRLTLPPAAQPRQRWLTPDELDALEQAARELREDPARIGRLELLLVLARYTGARKAAIHELPWSKVDLERRAIDFGPGAGRKRRARGAWIADELLAVLREAKLQATGPLVVGPGQLHWQLAKAAKAAGLEGVTPHVLRHSLASNAMQQGVAPHLVASQLGNTAAVVEKVYGHLTPQSLAPVAQAASGRRKKRA
jgi:integrase